LERTRIVLIDMPPLLREIVRDAVAREPDLELVAELEDGPGVAAALEHDGADFVIVGSDAAAAGQVSALVAAQRGLRALELRADGRESVLYELRPHRVPLGEISAETLVRTIRTASTWTGPTWPDSNERRTV
jgi:DNA-binding NarL/FixJ family response regulator